MQKTHLTIRDEIESINYPPVPHVLLRFLKVVEDDRASITEIANIVRLDSGLSARFLTVANSAALSRDKQAISIEQCVITLGTRLARTLAACLAIKSVFARTSDETEYDLKGHWKHSLKVAEIARALAAKEGSIDPEEAFLAGLIHDIGLLILLESAGKLYGDILHMSIDESVLTDIEKTMIGIEHTTVGALLVDKWKLSSFMSDAILFHHKSLVEIVEADTLSKIIWSAHTISSYDENLDLTHVEHTPDLTTVKSMLGIGINDISTIRDHSFERVTVIAEALGIPESTGTGTLPAPVVSSQTARTDRIISDPAYVQIDEQVRDMALLHSLQCDLTSMCSEEDLFIAIKESAKILFSLGKLAFLIINPAKNTLSGANFSGQSPLLQRLEIRLEPASSLVAAAAMGDQPCSTLDKDRPAAVSLVDVQIAHILDSEGLLYIPMNDLHGSNIGVMVYGISILQHSQLRKRLDWMARFAHLAAASIDAWHNLRKNEQQIEMNVADRFKLQARKIVHEAGNPLSIIKNYLKIVTRKIPDENNIHQELDILGEEINRVSSILQRLSSLSSTSVTTGTVDINSIIEGMLSLYGESLFSACSITVEKSLDPYLPSIPGDRDSIKQILLNIWKNTSEAMIAGGRVTVSTEGPVTKNGRSFVKIILSDSGPGLPPDVKQQLFQPLEQYRRPGHSGIGLSIVATLVTELGGFINCQSDPGQGTSYIILLPYASVSEQ